MLTEHQLSTHQVWCELQQPTSGEMDQVMATYEVPSRFKRYIKDRHEQPRFAYDEVQHFALLVLRQYHHVEARLQTMPDFMAFNDHVIITVAEQSVPAATDSFIPTSIEMVLTQRLGAIVEPYFEANMYVNQRLEVLESIKKRPSHTQLDVLAQLKKDLVYLMVGTSGNLAAVQELQSSASRQNIPFLVTTPQEHQRLLELEVEYEQCAKMFTLSRELTQQLDDMYTSTMNNDLNVTMKFLTVWSLILAIPPIVSGFYGMNVTLPFAGHRLAWFYTIVFTLVAIVAMVIYFDRHHKL